MTGNSIIYRRSSVFCFALLISPLPFVNSAVAESSKPSLMQARVEACGVLGASGDFISAIQHDDDNKGRFLREVARPWAPRYNRFAASSSAAILRQEAVSLARDPAQRYPAVSCSALKPLAEIAWKASVAASTGVRVRAGHVLVQCAKGFCIPPSIRLIGERCSFEPGAIPVQPAC